MWFIHKYKNGTMVVFTKIPQVKHTPSNSLYGIKKGSYIRCISGRIAKVEDVSIEQYGETYMITNLKCKFLDYGSILNLYPAVTLVCVKINIVNLFLYRIYKKLNIIISWEKK